MQKSSGETVYCAQVSEKPPLRVTDVGIWLRCDSRSGTRGVAGVPGPAPRRRRRPVLPGPGARHRARAHSIQIVTREETAASKTPRPHRVLRPQHQPRFTTKRPNTSSQGVPRSAQVNSSGKNKK
ncbi:unnamed protein product [Nyctereutes procyonoides]|uniref:(raccoon dog) hypothetical protein n=1 Tax=Nyctereutes procyonoides TaxID=34880 RepID=A0A811XYQ7_NYCPR|nr:unnamed protein product [Nyctereutes procyonoides]